MNLSAEQACRTWKTRFFRKVMLASKKYRSKTVTKNEKVYPYFVCRLRLISKCHLNVVLQLICLQLFTEFPIRSITVVVKMLKSLKKKKF